MSTKLHGSIILTYRCNAQCNMCKAWENPTKASDEIGLDVIEKLPKMFFVNITGGEPFVRQDLPEIVGVLRKKTKRIVISTNGFFTDRIVALCEKYPALGIRVSIEGLEKANDAIRGIPDGYNRTMETLAKLRKMGLKDIGFGMTVQDLNCQDLTALYSMAKKSGYEFATAALHNSHYFHKWDNRIEDKEQVAGQFKELTKLLLKSNRPKDWFRAYFNYGLINYIEGNRRLLPCQMGENGFFLDPWGDVLPCNGMDEKQSMGNLKQQNWDEIWNSKQAQQIRAKVRNCQKNCWMIGSAAPAIWQHPVKPILWVLRNKLGLLRHFGARNDRDRGLNKLKIAVLGTRGFPNVQGGVEAHCMNLYPHLAKDGCKVTVFGRAPYFKKKWDSPQKAGTVPIFYRGVKVVLLPCPKNKFLEAFLHTFYGVFAAKKASCDIVHIHAVGPALFVPLARLLGLKVVMTNHGPDYKRKKWGRLARFVLKLGEELGSRWANGVICISVEHAEKIKGKYKREVAVIPNGVNRMQVSADEDVLKRYGLSKGRYILAVGRFVPEKGFDCLVKAFGALSSWLIAHSKEWKLVIVGDADHPDRYSEDLKKMVTGINTDFKTQIGTDKSEIVLTGRLTGEPLEELYSHAGLFVLPSYYEGLPIVLLEAMSYGLSCIASDIPANREAGLSEERFFKAGDVQALAEKIREVGGRPLIEEEKARQMEMVAQRYDWGKIAQRTLEVYRQVLSS